MKKTSHTPSELTVCAAHYSFNTTLADILESGLSSQEYQEYRICLQELKSSAVEELLEKAITTSPEVPIRRLKRFIETVETLKSEEYLMELGLYLPRRTTSELLDLLGWLAPKEQPCVSLGKYKGRISDLPPDLKEAISRVIDRIAENCQNNCLHLPEGVGVYKKVEGATPAYFLLGIHRGRLGLARSGLSEPEFRLKEPDLQDLLLLLLESLRQQLFHGRRDLVCPFLGCPDYLDRSKSCVYRDFISRVRRNIGAENSKPIC
jgi:hypothetical protein